MKKPKVLVIGLKRRRLRVEPGSKKYVGEGNI
ncbi:hypothetical protein ES706_06517 [subsurface metagenome]